MAARLDSVGKYICEKSGWELSNLELQKIMFMAQMMHLGRYGTRLVDASFEAWDYGPVAPVLYHKLKSFGASAIEDIFYDARSFSQDDKRRATMDEVCDALIGRRPSDLIEITHWSKGAWAKHYVPGARGIKIPDQDIEQEYEDRLAEKR